MQPVEHLIEYAPTAVQEGLSVAWLGNPLWRWMVAAVVFLAVLSLLFLVRRLACNRLRRLTQRTETQIDDLLADLLDRTSRLFLLVVAVQLAAMPLLLAGGVAVAIRRLFAVAFFVQAGIWANHVMQWVIERYLRRKGEGEAPRAAVLSLFGFFGHVAVWSVVTLLALDNLGIDVTAAVAGLGIGGIAVGLALQNVLSDTFSSLAIILDKPFEEGDFIVVGDFMGTVERIGIKTTHVRSLGGEQIVFGNADLLSSRIRNYKRMQERRIIFGFGILYETPVAIVERIPGIVREVVEAQGNTRFDRAHFKAFGASSLDFEVVYYMLVPDYNPFMDVQQGINLELMRRFERLGVGFAYPTRTIHMVAATPAAEPVAAAPGVA